eukprot:scaffold6786_cov112-Isochrysis_galbana.AAC.4
MPQCMVGGGTGGAPKFSVSMKPAIAFLVLIVMSSSSSSGGLAASSNTTNGSNGPGAGVETGAAMLGTPTGAMDATTGRDAAPSGGRGVSPSKSRGASGSGVDSSRLRGASGIGVVSSSRRAMSGAGVPPAEC